MARLEIPDKVYFKIGEAAELVGVKPHVLRFWETEFPQVKPERAGSRQRLYTRKNVEVFLEIKRLLYEEQYTIAGAKKRLGAREQTTGGDETGVLSEIRNGLIEIKRLLDDS